MNRAMALLLALSCVANVGCAREVAPQHFNVTLDDDGTRHQGSIDFPAYDSSGGCVKDDSSKDPDESSCTPSALAIGTIYGLSPIVSAEIDLDKSTDEAEYVIHIENHDSAETFTCRMTSRDVGHAFECTTETSSPGALATITLMPT